MSKSRREKPRYQGTPASSESPFQKWATCCTFRSKASFQEENHGLKLDTDKIDDSALAILSLTLHDHNRVWKGLDWEITDRLFEKGLIENPRGKNKSIVLTDEGLARAQALIKSMFGKNE